MTMEDLFVEVQWSLLLAAANALEGRYVGAFWCSQWATFGLFWEGKLCAEPWPNSWVGQGITKDLTFLEFPPIIAAVVLWVKHFKNSTVHFWCDFQVVVQVIYFQSSRSALVMSLVNVCSTLLEAQHYVHSKACAGGGGGGLTMRWPMHSLVSSFTDSGPWCPGQPIIKCWC